MRPPNSILTLTRWAFRLPRPALRAFAGRSPRSDDGTPLDPQVGAVLALADKAGFPAMHELGVEVARQRMRDDAALVAARPEHLASVEDRFIPGPGGSLAVRVYRPGLGAKRPLLVYFHGGGFVVGSLDSHDIVCRRLAKLADAVVVAVDYRLAPEHPYPAAVDDTVAAFTFIAERAAEFGGDPERVGIGGDSAGGNISAVACRRLRDSGGPLPKAQILIYPATDLTMSYPSHQRYGQSYFLEGALIRWFRAHYLGDPRRAEEADASPIFARDLSGLPPALVTTAGFDPLRDEGEAYADALRDAGVSVRFRCESALIHGYLNMAGVSPACAAAVDEIARDIASLL